MRFLLIFLLVPLAIPLMQASAISCIKPIPYGDFQGDVFPAISNPECKNVTLFYDIKSDTAKEQNDTHIEFQVLNKLSRVVPHSTVQIMIKNDTTILFTDVFHTHSGYLNFRLQHDNDIDMWNYVENSKDKSLNDWRFNNDEAYTIQTPRLEYGRFNVEARLLTVYDDTYNFSPKGTPKFEFQLVVDQNGNISNDRNNLKPIKVTSDVQKCKDTPLGAKYGTPIDLEYDIHYGTVVNICKLEDTNSVITEINAEKDGQIIITIPKKVVHSLSSTDCADDSELLILMDNEEVLPFNYIHSKNDNIITVKFSKGVHTMEFIGFTILPDPSPAQYCGIVMGFDSLYLPPKFQIEKGMKTDQVRCNEGLTLIIKSNDESPACVKQETLQKLRERGWAEPLGDVVFQKPSKLTESTVSCPNQNMCTISVEGVILKSMPDRHESTYYFFTNDNIGSVKTGATGIPLEINQDKTIPTDLHGKIIKLRGQMFLEPFSKIFVEDLQIVRDLIPALSYNITDYMEIEQSDGKTEVVTMNELFQNPAKYYWKQVSVKGLLKERGAVGVPSIECISVNFEESQEFRFEAFRSPYVLEGIIHDNDVAVDARLGIRLESGEEYKFVDWERLPLDLKDKNVVVDGMFQPTVSNSGICKAVLHPAGYILTTFDKITITD